MDTSGSSAWQAPVTAGIGLRRRVQQLRGSMHAVPSLAAEKRHRTPLAATCAPYGEGLVPSSVRLLGAAAVAAVVGRPVPIWQMRQSGTEAVLAYSCPPKMPATRQLPDDTMATVEVSPSAIHARPVELATQKEEPSWETALQGSQGRRCRRRGHA